VCKNREFKGLKQMENWVKMEKSLAERIKDGSSKLTKDSQMKLI